MLDQNDSGAELDQLIAQVAQGDAAALDRLYAATSPRLHALCLSILPDRPTAETALQDTYRRVWMEARHHTASDLPAMTWLITTARNAALDRLQDQTAARLSSDADITARIERWQGSAIPQAMALTPILPPARARQMIRETLGHVAAPLTEDPLERRSGWRGALPLIVVVLTVALIWWLIAPA